MFTYTDGKSFPILWAALYPGVGDGESLIHVSMKFSWSSSARHKGRTRVGHRGGRTSSGWHWDPTWRT